MLLRMDTRSRKRLVVSVALLGVLALSACAGGSASKTGKEAFGSDNSAVKTVDDVYEFSDAVATIPGKRTDGPWKVEFTQYWTGLPVLQHYYDQIKEDAKQFSDITLSTSDGGNDPSKLVSNIDSAVARQVDLIIVAAGDGTVPAKAVERAVKAGIPVIAMQKRIATGDVSMTVVGDDLDQGKQQATGLVNTLKERNGGEAKGQVIIVNGPPGASLTVQQNKGFKEVISKSPDVKIVCDQNGQFKSDTAVTVTENCLQANADADAIWYLGASIGPALQTTLKRLGNSESVFLVGGGGNTETLKLMEQGGTAGSIQYDQIFCDCALPAIAAAHRILNGEDVPKEVIVKSPGVTPKSASELLSKNSGPYVTWPTLLPEPWQ